MKKRVGFCCKWIDSVEQIMSIGPKDDAKELNTRTVTATWMNRNAGNKAELKLWDIIEHNLNSVKLLLERTAARDSIYHMVRLGSDLLPLYTHDDWCDFYRRFGVQDRLEDMFGEIGQYAKEKDIRLSFHPGQFTVLASHRADVRRKSLQELEYHADMAHWMGYGQEFQDLKINIHISGQLGAYGVQQALPHMSPVAKRCLTIENDEMTWGIDESLKLEHDIALVVDIHHHWVKTGEYIEPDDPRMLRVIDSWRGVRPVIHYSLPREDVLIGHDVNTRPDFLKLMGSGYNRPKLRAHSDFYWNKACNDWAWSFLDKFDIQTESKGKNLSQEAFVTSQLTNTSSPQGG